MTKITDIENIHLIHDYGLDYNNNEIYVVSQEDYINGNGAEDSDQPGVEFVMANRFIKNLKILEKKLQSTDGITIHLKTNGGCWTQGMAMYDAIKSCRNTITMINYAEARSMSSLIYLAADVRLIHSHGKYMFHAGTVYDGGTVRQFRTAAEENEKAMTQMMDIYVQHLKKHKYWKNHTERQILNWLNKNMEKKEDVYFSAEEAIKYGFADRIIDQY